MVAKREDKTSMEIINKMVAESFTDLLPTKYMIGTEIAGKINANKRTIDISGHLSKGFGDAL